MPLPPGHDRRSRRPATLGLIATCVVGLGLVAWFAKDRPAKPRTAVDAPSAADPSLNLRRSADSKRNDSDGALSPEIWRRARSRSSVSEAAPSKDATPSDEPLVPWVKHLITGDGVTDLSRDELEGWINSGHTNASDFLAARQMGGGTEFLLRALKEFPDDPAVLLAAVGAGEDLADQRGEYLERLKQVAPSNALPHYLAAREAFRSGDPERAVQELTAATGKNQFEDYTSQSWAAAESLLRDLGRSDAEATAIGGSTVLLPHLSRLKAVATELSQLQKAATTAGDSARVEQLAELGWRLGQQLAEGPGSQHLIGELVGLTIQKLTLRDLDPALELPFLGENVEGTQAALDQRHGDLRKVAPDFNAWILHASEPEIAQYYQILRAHGESRAVEWIRASPTTPPTP